MEGDQIKIEAIRNALPYEYSDIKLTDDDFVDALYSLIYDRNIPVITIMGAGGTGKSFMYKVYSSCFGRVLCTATTGIAAFNLARDGIAAMTLHSALKIKPLPWFDEDDSGAFFDVFDKYDELFIDEVSMLNANMLDFILNKAKTENLGRVKEHKPIFRVVLFGDTLQLPPVVKDRVDNTWYLWEKEYGGKHMFYNSKCFAEYREHNKSRFFFLDEIHRQDRREFMNILNEVRFACPSDETMAKINSHVIDLESFMKGTGKSGMMYLATKNSTVKEINSKFEKMLIANKAEKRRYIAKEEGDPDWENYFTSLNKKIDLYVGQQVMCTANAVDKSYMNGTLGIVIGFTLCPTLFPEVDGNKLTPFQKEIKELNEGFILPIVENNERKFIVFRNKYEEYTIRRVEKDGTHTKPEVKGSVIQIACKPAYACTIHKSQGLTLNAVYLDTSDSPMDNSVYVALSRLKSLDGLGLKVPISKSDIKTNEDSLKLYIEFNAMVPD